MGWIQRMCMKKGCENIRGDRTWFNDDYYDLNPFLCAKCLDLPDPKPEEVEFSNDDYNIQPDEEE